MLDAFTTHSIADDGTFGTSRQESSPDQDHFPTSNSSRQEPRPVYRLKINHPVRLSAHEKPRRRAGFLIGAAGL